MAKYIEALGFTEVATYEPGDMEKYDGSRVFCHPDYATRITVENDGEMMYYHCKSGEYRLLNIQVANILLGEYQSYLTPFVELGFRVHAHNATKEVEVVSNEFDERLSKWEKILVKINFTNGAPKYLVAVDRNFESLDATDKNIVTVLKKRRPRFFELREIRLLRERCQELERKNTELEQQIKYMPGGLEYENAKKRFESTAEEQKRKKQRTGDEE